MIINYMEETKEIETVSRYNGGWLKRITGLDKSVNNGYSLIGDFVEGGDYKNTYEEGLYLDCSKEGSRKNQVWNYHLFRFSEENGVEVLQVLEDAGRTWAVEFWDTIEKELNTGEDKVQTILNNIFEETTDNETLLQVILGLIDKIEKTEDKITITEKIIGKEIFNNINIDEYIEEFLQGQNQEYEQNIFKEETERKIIAEAYLTSKEISDENKCNYEFDRKDILLSEAIGHNIVEDYKYELANTKYGRALIKITEDTIEVTKIIGDR